MQLQHRHSYDSNTRCLITIQKFKRSVCHLDLVFIKFDLGATADCDSYTDYLSINGERFCGHYYHNRSLHFSMPDDVAKAVRVRTFRFDGPTLQMRFNGQIGTGKSKAIDLRLSFASCQSLTDLTRILTDLFQWTHCP